MVYKGEKKWYDNVNLLHLKTKRENIQKAPSFKFKNRCKH